MSLSSKNTETCPSDGDHLSQLLHAPKKKLQDIALGGRIAATVNQSEVDSFEQDASEVLSLARSIKNSFAPINRIHPEVLSLIPDYHREDEAGQDVITLTHVCRRWRDTFTSRPSLWAQLDFKNVDKTRTYIQRSKSSPLKFCLGPGKVTNDAFALAIPHAHRLKSLTVSEANALRVVLKRFRCHAPSLDKLDIGISSKKEPTLDGALFNGDLSFLRELRLSGVITTLPWKNLVNLRVVDLNCHYRGCGVTRLLDFFESAPLLHTVTIEHSKMGSSDAPPGRMVHLRHLQLFCIINADISHSILLHHLHIPIGTTLISSFTSDYDEFPPLDLDYLPERFPNLANLPHITAINLDFGPGLKVQLSGPSGTLRVLVSCNPWYFPAPYDNVRQALRSFNRSMLSTIQRLVVSHYMYPSPARVEACPTFQTLSSMNNLRTLVLFDGDDLHFTLLLDPEQNSKNRVLCPDMEELVVYIAIKGEFHVEELVRMAKNRASRGGKLSSIKIVYPGVLMRGEEVKKLRKHVMHAECLVDNRPHRWDSVDW